MLLSPIFFFYSFKSYFAYSSKYHVKNVTDDVTATAL